MPSIYKGPAYKTVDWSYPTSANAKHFKFPNGCFTISLTFFGKDHTGKACAKSESVKGFATREEAQAFADITFPEIPQLRAPAKYGEVTESDHALLKALNA